MSKPSEVLERALLYISNFDNWTKGEFGVVLDKGVAVPHCAIGALDHSFAPTPYKPIALDIAEEYVLIDYDTMEEAEAAGVNPLDYVDDAFVEEKVFDLDLERALTDPTYGACIEALFDSLPVQPMGWEEEENWSPVTNAYKDKRRKYGAMLSGIIDYNDSTSHERVLAWFQRAVDRAKVNYDVRTTRA